MIKKIGVQTVGLLETYFWTICIDRHNDYGIVIRFLSVTESDQEDVTLIITRATTDVMTISFHMEFEETFLNFLMILKNKMNIKKNST